MTEQDNVIPLEIKGSVTVYNQSYVNKLNEKLTKAKEIIKKLVDGIMVISDPKVELTDVNSFVAEAEKFLKESEVEK